jgi:hypothetical protein
MTRENGYWKKLKKAKSPQEVVEKAILVTTEKKLKQFLGDLSI